MIYSSSKISIPFKSNKISSVVILYKSNLSITLLHPLFFLYYLRINQTLNDFLHKLSFLYSNTSYSYMIIVNRYS